MDPVKKNQKFETVAAHSISAGQEIVPNRIGTEVNIFASNWCAMMASSNERGLMNFVCTVFEQGDEMLTLLSMEKNNGRMQPKSAFSNKG